MLSMTTYTTIYAVRHHLCGGVYTTYVLRDHQARAHPLLTFLSSFEITQSLES